MPVAPSNQNVTLGRGEIWFRRTDEDKGFIHLGNCQSLAIGFEDNVIRTMNKMKAVGGTYRRVVVDRQCTVSIDGQEFNPDLMALATSALVPTDLSQTSGSATDEVLATAAQATGDRAFQTAFRRISSVVITQGATTLAAGDDYTVTDAVAGIITFHADGTDFADATQIDIDYDYAADANPTVAGGSKNQIEGTLLFKSDDATGMTKDCIIWNVVFSPEGELQFIGDEFLSWTLSGEALDESATYPNEPFFRLYDRNVYR